MSGARIIEGLREAIRMTSEMDATALGASPIDAMAAKRARAFVEHFTNSIAPAINWKTGELLRDYVERFWKDAEASGRESARISIAAWAETVLPEVALAIRERHDEMPRP